MGSDFSEKLSAPSLQPGWTERLDVVSERFDFFKTRVYGALQVIKEPKPAFASDFQTLESLRKEFHICFSLNHPSVPRYYKFEDNRLYEEYIEGSTLGDMLERGDERLRSGEFVESVIRQLFDTLDYLHSRGVIHRDIKPENLMITDRGDRLKIIDFGAAESAECDTTSGYTAHTLAPEQGDLHADVQTDIYQAGLVVTRLCEGIPDRKRWRSFIRKATAALPSGRFKTSREAVESLPKPAKKRTLLFGAAGIVLLVFLVGAGGYVLRSADEKQGEGSVSGVTLSAEASPQPLAEAVGESGEKGAREPGETNVGESAAAGMDPEAPAAPANPKPAPREDLNTTLQKKVKEYIDLRMNARMGRYMNPPYPLDEEGCVDPKFEQGMYTSLQEVLDEVMGYCARLSAQYPQQRDLIEETAIKTLETRSSMYVMRFNRYSEELIRKRDAARQSEG